MSRTVDTALFCPPNEESAVAQGASEIEAPIWTTLMAEEQWEIYRAAINALRVAKIPFMLGGAFGLAAYTGRLRNTKDLDLYLRPRDRSDAITALSQIGCSDYFDQLPYDRGWIYRSIRSDIIVDLIWGTPNRRTEVTDQWLEHAPELVLRGERVLVLPAEELIFVKLYVLQRDRSDWPDLINLLYSTSAALKWDRLIGQLSDDLPLLTALLAVFAWACPNRIGDIPPTLRRAAGIIKPRRLAAEPHRRHIQLLDSRGWFAAFQPSDQPLPV
jgi:hypothetical protein